jgi:CheY-like chemotaxis protein
MTRRLETSPKVLVVEDHADGREILREYLDHEGYTTFVAQDGVEALRLLDTDHFALVILDIRMPSVSGLDVLERVPGGRLPPVIVYTGDAKVLPLARAHPAVVAAILKPGLEAVMAAAATACKPT